MKNTLVLLICSLLASPSFAQSFVVKKVKGRQAIVDVQKGELEEGQVYSIGDAAVVPTLVEKSSPMPVQRDHLIGISGSFFSKTSETKISSITTSSTSSYLTGALKYGWNTGIFEFGGSASFTSESVGGSSTNSYGAGGWMDFNFGHNKAGNNSLFGVGLDGTYSGGSSAISNTTTISLFPSGYWKWFPFAGSNIGIRSDVGFYYAKETQGSTETTNSGPKVVVALLNYF